VTGTDIESHPIHLGVGASAQVEPLFTGRWSGATVSLAPGQYAINEPGTWHTADVEGPATALFITAGWGTQHRPR
jgi:hypothetical protein